MSRVRERVLAAANGPELRSLVAQGTSRVSALTLPLATVVGVRYLAPEGFERTFFTALTDTALLVAVVKLGVDVYLPSCGTNRGRAVVSTGYRTAYACVVSALIAASLLLYSRSGSWEVPLAAAAVLCCLAIAEVGRLNAQFTTFYFLKAPSLYVGVLAICLAGIGGSAGAFVSLGAVLAAATLAWNKFETRNAEIDTSSLVVGALVSLLVVAFGWKEAAASRYLFSGDQLAELVMYSRFTLIATFPFMLRNARVPLVMRSATVPSGREAIDRATRAGRRVNLVWAVGSGALITCYALVTEPENTVGVAALMAGACVVVVFGNMNACLVYLRDYSALVRAHTIGLAVFLACALAFDRMLADERFLSIALASLVGQVALGVTLKMALEHWRSSRTS